MTRRCRRLFPSGLHRRDHRVENFARGGPEGERLNKKRDGAANAANRTYRPVR